MPPGQTRATLGTIASALVLASLLASTPASAATQRYWSGSQGSTVWKSSTLTTMYGGRMTVVASFYNATMQTRTATGTVTGQGDSYGSDLTYTHGSQTSRRSWCKWKPPSGDVTAVASTTCSYFN